MNLRVDTKQYENAGFELNNSVPNAYVRGLKPLDYYISFVCYFFLPEKFGVRLCCFTSFDAIHDSSWGLNRSSFSPMISKRNMRPRTTTSTHSMSMTGMCNSVNASCASKNCFAGIHDDSYT